MFSKKSVLIAGAVVAALTVGGTSFAVASSGGPGTIYACTRNDHDSYTTSRWWQHAPATCPKGWSLWTVGSGAAGPAGPAGPSGVVATTSKQLLTASATVKTGGSFTSNKTEVGTVQLAAGTYLLNVAFKATPNATTTGDVFPQLFAYNGTQAADFSNDLFNVGSGSLENPTASELSNGNVIDSYYSGTEQVTVPAGGMTLYVYAFGYDSDGGSGSYTLDSATVTATQLQTAS